MGDKFDVKGNKNCKSIKEIGWIDLLLLGRVLEYICKIDIF